ncbi:hypothetical protein BDQ12DRAFT_729303 [Crucibulum laeve]|uniref:Uncharacterized protein n=1 Tax=Crucibulum laeve TaxID=68775 RepID=A0A5C3LG43_9AGAR|nr:hypothetical protein BDQ12DRAFT_729303 [Crucibulum laeve]
MYKLVPTPDSVFVVAARPLNTAVLTTLPKSPLVLALEICRHTASQVNAAKLSAASSGYADENLAKYLRNFTSTHTALLGWAGFQAFQLKRVPANVRQSALLVELSYQGGDSHRKYVILSCSPSLLHTSCPAHTSATPSSDDTHRRENRCRHNGGIGTLVVVIQCRSVSQVMPVEVDPPSKIIWDTWEDWATVLSHFVDSGRTDFKPISTTSRGVYYG